MERVWGKGAVSVSREGWNLFVTGYQRGHELPLGEPHPSIMSFYCFADQIEEIEAETGEPFSEEHRAACRLLSEIVERVNGADTGDSEVVTIARADHDALLRLVEHAESQVAGLALARHLEPVEG